jgi:Enoyl-CoA hydratase/isomerase
VTSDLAGRQASGLPPQILPLRHTGGTDLKRLGNRTDRLAGVSPRQSPFANVFRIGSRHPCWPLFPSMDLESEILPTGNPDSGKKQHALTAEQAHAVGLVDELAGGASALEHALAFTERLAKMAPLALSSIKTVVRASVRSSAKVGAQVATREFEKLWFTVDHREAEAAFVEKRQPSFIGK